MAPKNPFLHRLIPLGVTAAGMTIACGPDSPAKSVPGNSNPNGRPFTQPNAQANGTVTPNPTTNPNDAGIIVNGRLDQFDFQQFCTAWQRCDPSYFAESYSSVQACSTGAYADYREQAEQYAQDYSLECAQIRQAFTECLGTAFECENGEWDLNYDGYDACAASFYSRVEAACDE